MVTNYLARVVLACPHLVRALLLTKPGNVGVYGESFVPMCLMCHANVLGNEGCVGK
jgi:hypothetical protein